MRRERIASAVTALALVLAAVGGGLGPASVTQTASAEFVDCQLNDSIIAAGLATLTGDTSGCYWDPGLDGDTENITKTDAYASALSLKDSTSSYLTTVQNFQENQRRVAWTKAKIEVVQGLENGTGEAETRNIANTTIRDYYSRAQLKAVKDGNAKVQQLAYLAETGVGLRFNRGSDTYGVTNNTFTYQETLANGTTVNATAIEYDDGDSTTTNLWTPWTLDYQTLPTTIDGQQVGWQTAIESVEAQDPQSGSWTKILYSSGYAASQPTYHETFSEFGNQSEQITANVDAYVSDVYQQYTAGELNATTIAQNDPTLLASEATTSYNSTGYYGYSAASLAAIGYGGDLNQSHVIQINGANYSGTLFYSGPDGTEFQTGQTYDFANYSGSFYFAASDTPQNDTGIIRLDDRGSSFTIVEATNTQTGESVNSTTTQKYVYESANATNLQQEIDRLEELRDYYESQNTSGPGIPIGTEDKAIIGVIAVAVILLLTRN